MNFEAARAAIYGRLDTLMAASYPSVPTRYENRLTVDLATVEDLFVACEIALSDGGQAALGDNGLDRYSGAIYLAVWEKEGAGTAAAWQILDALNLSFKKKQFGGVNTKVPRPLPGYAQSGKYVLTLRVPCWFDQ